MRSKLTTTLLCTLATAGLLAQAPGAKPPDLNAAARASLAQLDGTLLVYGLREPVEVVRDRWGIPHIYARNTADLFFAQGYVVAQDRMWQLEMWRRNGEGRLAEILGPDYVTRDRFARLLAFRDNVQPGIRVSTVRAVQSGCGRNPMTWNSTGILFSSSAF